jgi:hypothetical protein
MFTFFLILYTVQTNRKKNSGKRSHPTPALLAWGELFLWIEVLHPVGVDTYAEYI